MIDWILGLLGTVLKFFDTITGNYLLAILLFALLFKILLFPFSIKQQKNSVKQASLQPKVKAIQNRYKGRDDQASKQKMQQETMDLYNAEGFNPMGGCLPLLLQFPIILALYQIIRNPLQYICGVSKDAINVLYSAAEALEFKVTKGDGLTLMRVVRDHFTQMQEKAAELAGDVDISTFTALKSADLPDFSLFGLNFDLSVQPTIALNWYLLIPVLTFVTIFLTTKLTRKLSAVQQDPSMQNGCSTWMMDITMPLMSTYFTFMFPAVLGVYWMFNNLLGVAQSLILRLMYPAPKFTEEDYKEAARQMRGKASSSIEADSRVVPGKKYKSLHHIDDDDEKELPVLPLDSRESDDSKTDTVEKVSEAPKLKKDTRKKK